MIELSFRQGQVELKGKTRNIKKLASGTRSDSFRSRPSTSTRKASNAFDFAVFMVHSQFPQIATNSVIGNGSG
jgi:hypothetical protein